MNYTNENTFEVIDILDSAKTCSSLLGTTFSLDGAYGGVNKAGEPWTCGGLLSANVNKPNRVCRTYRTGLRLITFENERAYSGISSLAPGSYLITGGVQNRLKPASKVEIMTNDSWNVSLPNLNRVIYQHCQVSLSTNDQASLVFEVGLS